jgi:hypothetical protein
MAGPRESQGLSRGTQGSGVKGARVDNKPTLASVGIDKHLADRARKYAAVPQESSRLSAAMYLFPLRPTCAPSGVEQPKDGREREQDDGDAER